MNCKPGDIARIVNSLHGNDGRIVRCVRFVGLHLFNSPVVDLQPAWEVDPPFRVPWGFNNICPDKNLRPIRDPGDDAKDEMLRPLPKELEHA